jgi:simple sugar transport system permease protein
MSKSENKSKFQLFFIDLNIKFKKFVKRQKEEPNSSWHNFKSGPFIPTVISIIIGLFLALLIMLITRGDIGESFGGFSTLLFGGFSSLGNVFFHAGPLIILGLSVAVGFKTGLFNIGTPGQFTMGGITALYIANLFPQIRVIHLLLCILGAVVVGAIWGMIPGLLKAFYNISEVITSIMLNYIAVYITLSLVKNKLVYDSSSARVRIPPSTALLPTLNIPGQNIDIGIFIAIFAVIIVYFILYHLKFGYKLIAVGLNPEASRYAGMSPKKLIVVSMAICGALAGLAAVLSYLSATSLEVMRPETSVKTFAFDGIFIALIGASNPIGVGFAALFVSFLRQGATSVQLYGFRKDSVDLIVGIIIYLIAIQSVFRTSLPKIWNWLKRLFKKKEKNKND